ncbi:MAG: response regulator [Alphaproteobacteria bacterium]|nr:response regulator [Alphaproteobacteria bacterium]
MAPIGPGVLVVCAEDEARERMMQVLDDAGLRVGTARYGRAALAQLQRRVFELAIIDVSVPGIAENDDFIRQVRARCPDLKILFLARTTERLMLKDRDREDVLVKPFSGRELLGCVFELLLRESEREGGVERRYAAEFGLSGAKLECLRQRRATAISGGDAELTRELERDIEQAVASSRRLPESLPSL